MLWVFLFFGWFDGQLFFCFFFVDQSLFQGVQASWFYSRQQQIPPLTHSLTSGFGEGIRRVKVRKLVVGDKDSLIGKAKTAHTGKEQKGIN